MAIFVIDIKLENLICLLIIMFSSYVTYSEELFSNSILWGNYSIVKPGNSKKIKRFIPNYIKKPLYYYGTNKYKKNKSHKNRIEIKTTEQLNIMRPVCKLASKILKYVGEKIKVGMTTNEIDDIVFNMSIANRAYPSPLNFFGFPKSVCTSINNVAVHGIPDDRQLIDGDIINVDITIYKNGFHCDCSTTFLVGNVDSKGTELVYINRYSLNKVISILKPGCRFSKIGEVIEEIANDNSYNVVPDYIGHGIGTEFHMPPDIFPIKNKYPGVMKPGMTFTIEPIFSQGTGDTIVLKDGWTAVTKDNSRTAQAEHTVLITENGAEILTE